MTESSRKTNGLWDLGYFTAPCQGLETDTLRVLEEQASPNTAASIAIHADTGNGYLLLSPEDSQRLRQYLKKCEQNFYQRRRDAACSARTGRIWN